MGKYWRQSGSRIAIMVILLVYFCPMAMADPIKDKLDTARDTYDTTVAKAAIDLTNAFDVQIKAVSQTGDLDAVEQLRSQRTAFVSSKALPSAATMRQGVAQYQQGMVSAESTLKAVYETAVSDYTKAGRFDDAEMIKHAMDQRFIPQTPVGNGNVPTTMPADPIMDKLNVAKKEFAHNILDAHQVILALIDAKAKAAEDRGDLDAFKEFNSLSAMVKTEIFVPADVKDTDLRTANARFLETARTAYDKLVLIYQSTIADLTKARRIDEAEVVQAELGDGGWFHAYTGRPETVDMLKLIDIRRDTIRKGWVIQNGVLQPTRWDDDHGPYIKVPVSVKGNYQLHVKFKLAVAAEAVYVHVPIGSKWGVIVLASARQDFDNVQGRGEIHGFVSIPLKSDADAVFRVTCAPDGSVKFVLSINDQESITWTGNSQSIANGGDFWGLDDQSCFAVDTKSATITGMELQAPSYVLPNR